MRVALLLATFGALAVQGCVSSPPPPSAEAGDLKLLKGSSLRSAIVGFGFSYEMSKDIVVSGGTCQFFERNGEYRRCSDRVPFTTGTYAIRKDEVCPKLGETEQCFRVYSGPEESFWFSQVAGPGHISKVCRWPIEFSGPDCTTDD